MEWRARARKMLSQVDPVAFADVVICDRAEVPDYLDCRRNWLMLGGPQLGAMLPGGSPGSVGILTHDLRIKREYPWADGGGLDRIRLHLAIHEAAHAVEHGRESAMHPAVAAAAQRVCAGIDPPLPRVVFPEPAGKWDEHGIHFVRSALHIWARARHHGHEVELAWLDVAGPAYGLSHACEYALALDDEPERLSGICLLDLRDHEAPAEFCSLWKRDTMKSETPERHPCGCSFCPPSPTNIGKPYAKSNGATYLRCRRCRWTWTMDSRQCEAAMASSPAPVAEVAR